MYSGYNFGSSTSLVCFIISREIQLEPVRIYPLYGIERCPHLRGKIHGKYRKYNPHMRLTTVLTGDGDGLQVRGPD